jgi:hypothetical protein
MNRQSIWVKYGYLWVTLILFGGSVLGHWMFGWEAFVNEQQAHGEPIVVSDFWAEMLRDTFENWQSEFLQLIWQVAGLSFLLYLGSPQSKEEDERLEDKLDHILRQVDKEKGEEMIKHLDEKYGRS